MSQNGSCTDNFTLYHYNKYFTTARDVRHTSPMRCLLPAVAHSGKYLYETSRNGIGKDQLGIQ
jgi:hypothetical protein